MFIPYAQSARKAARSDIASPSSRIESYRGSNGFFSTLTAVAALLAAIRPAPAAPRGGAVVEGTATISQSGPVTTIDQSTNRAVIDWLGFSIGAGETVNFNQPTSLSVTLNRVIGNESSVIAGALNANGRVFLVNSNGVLFTKDAQVNVGGLVASTLDISNRDFMAGNYRFSGSSNAAVANRGEIRASEGGYVALLGRTVSNEGAITATLGSIALAAGDKITLNFGGDSLVDVSIDKGTYKALVDNKGLVKADGGRVVMTAKAADAVLSAQVNNSGIVQARTLTDLVGGSSTPRGSARVGSIKLLASGGRTKVSGKLDASAPRGGRGGVIDTSGDKVTIADGAVITTKSASGQNGDWIIDPDGFTIAASGGNITGAALGAQLESNNITIYSTQGSGNNGQDLGDIDINDPVSWASSSTLTLNANGSIHVNAPFKATAGALQLNAGWDIIVNAANSLDVSSLHANANGNTLFIKAAQNWANAGDWTLSGTNVYIYKPLAWSTDSTLTISSTRAISVNAPITGTGAASHLVMNAGTDINVNIASAFAADTVDVTAAQRLNINAEQHWTTLAGQWSLTGGDVYVYDKIDWSGVTPLNISSTRTINLLATISGGFNLESLLRGVQRTPTLVLNAGTDLNLYAESVLSIDTDATAVGNVNIEAPQAWIGAGSWTLSGRNVNVNDSIYLAFGELTLRATDDIKVHSRVDWWWSALALDAGANVIVDSVMSQSLFGNLTIDHGSGINADGTPNGLYMGLADPGGYVGRIDFGTTGRLTIAGELYTVIDSAGALGAIAQNGSGNYALGSNLSNLGWGHLQPFLSAGAFTGRFNGLGHSLALAPQSSIVIDSPLAIAELKNTNLLFASLGDIVIGAPVTSGAGLLTLSAAGNIDLGASLSSGADASASFALAGSRITISDSVGVTGGNIFVDAPLSWSSNTLTLAAKQFIDLNAPLSASGAARLVMSYAEGMNADGTPQGGLNAAYDSAKGAFVGKIDFASGMASDALTINAHPYTLISSMAQLAAVSEQTDAHFALATDLNAAGHGSNADGSYAGAVVATLSSSLEGLGHTVGDLTIRDTAGNGSNGLIGAVDSGLLVSNIAVKNASVTGSVIYVDGELWAVSDFNGSLIGVNRGNVTNAYGFDVTVTSPGSRDGGLIGSNFAGLVNNAHAYHVDVSGGTIGAGHSSVGGLIGFNRGFDATNGIIDNSSASGVVGPSEASSPYDVRSSYGGLVGMNFGGTIYKSVAEVDVSFPTLNIDSMGRVDYLDGMDIGGLVGTNSNVGLTLGRIIDSAAYGEVRAVSDYIGGLVGNNVGGVIIGSNAYGRVENAAPARVSEVDGTSHPGVIGGLVGNTEASFAAVFQDDQLVFLDVGGDIINSFAYGEVYAPNAGSVGGFVGMINKGVDNGPVIVGSAAYGNVTGGYSVGGFFGANVGGVLAHDAAYGDVSGANVGGFGGQNGVLTLIIHSSASGNVTFTGDPADVYSGTGGFLGFNGGSVVNSTSSGAVNGNANVGGFIGFNLAYDTITGTGFVGPGNSTTSSVTGVDATSTAGFVGTNEGGRIQGGSFVGQPGQPSSGVGNQIGGNDDDVTAPSDPSAAAATTAAARENQSRAAQTANSVMGDAETLVKRNLPAASSVAAGKAAAAATASAKLEENLKVEEPPPPPPPATAEQKPRPRRHAAASAPAQKPHGGGQGGAYGARIRSIDVDGQRFDLNRGSATPNNR
jgi:filamentous hemagglutinin family protein